MSNEHFSQFIESSATKDEVTERITECFDTSQPIDSLTGTPPLQCRITERIDSRQNNNARNDIDRSTQTSSITGIENTYEQNEEIYNNGVTQETQVSDRRSKLIGFDKIQIAVCVILSIFLLWLLFTVGKAIKSFKN